MKTIISIITLLILTSCTTTLLFKNPLPQKGLIIHELPSALEGIYHADEDITYNKIQKSDNNRWFIYSFMRIHKDSMTNYIQSLDTDSTQAKLRGNLLTITHKPSNTTKQKGYFSLVNNYYSTPQKLTFEINLEQNYVVDNFDNIKEEEVIVKQLNDIIYLNIKKDKGWYLIWFNKNDNDIVLKTSLINSDEIDRKINAFHEFPTIKRFDDTTCFTSPSDAEFFAMQNHEDFFYNTKWKKLINNDPIENKVDFTFNWNWILLVIGLFITAIILGLIFLNKPKNINN